MIKSTLQPPEGYKQRLMNLAQLSWPKVRALLIELESSQRTEEDKEAFYGKFEEVCKSIVLDHLTQADIVYIAQTKMIAGMSETLEKMLIIHNLGII